MNEKPTNQSDETKKPTEPQPSAEQAETIVPSAKEESNKEVKEESKKETKEETKEESKDTSPKKPKKLGFLSQGKGGSWVVLGVVIFLSVSLFMGGGYFLFLRTNLKKLRLVSMQLDLHQKMLKNITGASLSGFDGDKEQTRKLEKKIPTMGGISELLDIVTWSAEKSGLTLLNFSELMGEPMGTYVLVPIKLSLSGSFEELRQFLGNITSMDRLITVEELELEKFTSTSTGTTLSIEMSLLAYKGKVLGKQ